ASDGDTITLLSMYCGRPSSSARLVKRFSSQLDRRPSMGFISRIPIRLNAVWNTAMGSAGYSCSQESCRADHNTTGSSNKPIKALKLLIQTCPAATRRALGVAPITDNADVEVVPMVAPITIAAAAGNCIMPLDSAVSVSATVALDDWVSTVITIPIST